MKSIKHPGILSAVAVLAAGTAAGCGSSDNGDGDQGTDPGGEPQQTSSALMRRATDCADLEQGLKDELRARLKNASRAESAYLWADGANVDWAEDDGMAIAIGTASGAAPMDGMEERPMITPTTASTDPSANEFLPMDSGEAVQAAGPSEFTQTNTQVEGIDEADFVKTDGQYIYVLRSNLLSMANAWPAEQLSLAATAEVEGRPLEMYVVGDGQDAERTVVVHSVADGASIYQQAGLDLSEREAQVTKLTVLTAGTDTLKVVHEVYYDGSYVSSRRNGSRIRTVLHVEAPSSELRWYADSDDLQKAEMLVIEELLREDRSVADLSSEELDVLVQDKVGEVLVSENEAVIEAVAYQDWLPQVISSADSRLTASPMQCEDFYVPLAGTSDPGITHVAELNLDELDATQARAVLGIATTMYENASTMVLASSTMAWPEEPADDGEEAEPSEVTYLHAFDLSDPAEISYTASGSVTGRIKDQFSLDEQDGDLRVVTTEDSWWASDSVNHLFVLQAADAELEVVGDAGPLAPGETVRAVRFVGDTGYVVTFRQVDPLFVIDLSDATQPTVLGELKIPGFSEYMHPLDDDHLLTVGQDADPETGWQTGNVALQIFDVTDRTDPLLQHKHVFERVGTTEGSVTHKAVTYFPARGLLALPFLTEEHSADYSWWGLSSTLELFSVDLDTGIVPQGAINGDLLRSDAEQPGSGYYCEPYYYAGMDGTMLERGIFFDQYLYAVARAGIIVAPVSAPAEHVAVLKLAPADEVPEYCYAEGIMVEPGIGAVGGVAVPAIDVGDAPLATGGTGGTTAGGNDPACPIEAPEDGTECELPGLNNCSYTDTSCLCTTPASADVIPEWYCWETTTTDTDTDSTDSAAAGGAGGASG
jgi:hypothetical protein